MNAQSVRRKPRGKGKGKEKEKGLQMRTRRKASAKPPMRFTIDSSIHVPKVKEPGEECAICHKRIESIASAISEPGGGHSHFDCVIEKLKAGRSLAANQKISYLGRGVFGVVESSSGKFSIVERIVYESPEDLAGMKRFVESAKV